MRSIDVALIVVSADASAREPARVILVGQDEVNPSGLPQVQLSDGTVFDAAAGLLKRLTGLTARRDGHGWSRLTQHDVVDWAVRLVERRHQTGGDPWFEPVTEVRHSMLVPYSTTFDASVVDLLDPNAYWAPLAEVLGGTLAQDHKTILQGVIARM